MNDADRATTHPQASHGNLPRVSEGSGQQPTDPVCGMRVDPTATTHRAMHDGRDYYFCCAGCRGKFLADPMHYSVLYNTLGIPLAAGALYPAFGLLLRPIVAAVAMSLSSVSVITNALRLQRTRL